MLEEITIANLVQKLGEIRDDLKKVYTDIENKGRNFRAVSESKIFESLKPLLQKYSLIMFPRIKSQKVFYEQGRCNAVVEVQVVFKDEYEEVVFEGVGMGIDTCDKAIGKAFTYAYKYALLKGFQIEYCDDPDAYEDDEAKNKEQPKKAKEKEPSRSGEKISEKMLNYITGLLKEISNANVVDEVKDRFGYHPQDKNMPMSIARDVISFLKDYNDDLPF